MWSWLRGARREDPQARLKEALGEYELPSFPRVANRVLGLLRDPNVSLTQVGDALAEDPKLAVRVLSITNSSAFALRNPVQNVSQASTLLGRASLESLVLGVVVARSLPDPRIDGFDCRAFWHGAARRAAAARALADLLHPRTRSEAFTASLLSDMAVPLIGVAHGASYGALLRQHEADGGDLAALEREALGFDHATIAGWLARAWSFPDRLTDAIGSHHDEEASSTDLPAAVALVAPLGNDAASEDRVVDLVRSRFGVGADTVVEVLERAARDADEIAARML
ncbi:MAG: HDOD domain-containing protein [Myxococcales bacterium]|nr:HDOD domain-containing protein [Myxococcales bacterium]